MISLGGTNRYNNSLSAEKAGSAAVLFALLLPIMIGSMGLGFDAVRGMLVKQRMQQSLDAASVGAATSSGTDAELKQLASNIFAANFGTGFLAPPTTPEVEIGADGRITVTASATFDTFFMRLFEADKLTIGGHSVASRPTGDIEVALVVDISGSMSLNAGGGMNRIEALRIAAHDLVNILDGKKPPGSSLKFTIVPYNVNVNIGTSNAGWVDQTTHPLFTGTNWAGCVQERRPPYHISDDYNPGAADGSGKWHAYIWPPEPNSGSPGCENLSDGTNDGYNAVAERPPGEDEVKGPGPNFNCSRQPIVPLTSDLTVIRNAIDDLHYAYNAGTILAPGVSWGLRALSPEQPFTEGAAYSNLTRKIMIVLTDGLQVNDYDNDMGCSVAVNTVTPYAFDPSDFGMSGRKLTAGPIDIWTAYGYLEDSEPFDGMKSSQGKKYKGLEFTEQADLLLVDACDYAKNEAKSRGGQMDIFTVAFGSEPVPSTSVAKALKACATSEDHFHYAPNTSALREVFGDIANLSATLRLVD